MSGLLLFFHRRNKAGDAHLHKQNVRSKCHHVNTAQSKSVEMIVGYLDEFGNHHTRPTLHWYFIGRTKQIHREANYTDNMYEINSNISVPHIPEWYIIRLMDLGIILMQVKQSPLTTWNKMSSNVRIRVQDFGSIYSSGSDGYCLHKKFSALCPKECKVMCHTIISLFYSAFCKSL